MASLESVDKMARFRFLTTVSLKWTKRTFKARRGTFANSVLLSVWGFFAEFDGLLKAKQKYWGIWGHCDVFSTTLCPENTSRA